MAPYAFVQYMEKLRCWKLVRIEQNTQEHEEVVLRIQGIICDKSIPPIKRPFEMYVYDTKVWAAFSTYVYRESRRRKYLRQSVMLTGFGSDIIKKAIDNIRYIHGLFDQEFMQGELEAWTPGRFGQFDAIDISNRYFTRRCDMNGEAPIQFSHAIDPENILTNALSNDFVHIQENVVEYYEAVEKDNKIKWEYCYSFQRTTYKNAYRYIDINPGRIQRGDVLEIQASFIVVPLKAKKYKMLVVLRAITVLDNSATKVSVKL
jgi:hypothetical protein